MEKQINQDIQTSQELNANRLVNFKNEIEESNQKKLKLVAMKLNYLCLSFDPYKTDDISIEETNILNEFNLNEFLSNPFDFTNHVLRLLDIVETEIKRRNQ